QAEDGIRDFHVTGVQTCALPISTSPRSTSTVRPSRASSANGSSGEGRGLGVIAGLSVRAALTQQDRLGGGLLQGIANTPPSAGEIGRAACREGGERTGACDACER